MEPHHIKEADGIVECQGGEDCPLCQLFGTPDITIPIFDVTGNKVLFTKISQRTARKVFGRDWHDQIPSID